MTNQELREILVNLLKKDKNNENSRPSLSLLIDMLNNSNINSDLLDNLIQYIFSKYYSYQGHEDFDNKEDDPQLQNIHIFDRDNINNHSFKNDYSNENSLKNDNKTLSMSSEELVNLVKSLINHSLKNILISSTEIDRNTSNIFQKYSHPQFSYEYNDHKLQNEQSRNTQYNLRNDNSFENSVYNNDYNKNDLSDNFKKHISSFIKLINLPNKTGRFKYAILYEEMKNNLNKNTNSYDKKTSNYTTNKQDISSVDRNYIKNVAFVQNYNQQAIDNQNTYSSKNDNKYKFEEDINNVHILSEKGLQTKQNRQRSVNTSYEPRYISMYENNFKPLKYVRVRESSEKINTLFKNRLK